MGGSTLRTQLQFTATAPRRTFASLTFSAKMVRPATSLAAVAACLAASSARADFLLGQKYADAGCTGEVLATTYSPGTTTECVSFVGGFGMKYACVDSTTANQYLYMAPDCSGDPLGPPSPVPLGVCDPAALTIQTCLAGTAPADLPHTRASLAVDAYFTEDANICADLPAAAKYKLTRQALVTGVCASLNATHSYQASCDSATSTGVQSLYVGANCGGSVVDRMAYPSCGTMPENEGLAFVTTCLPASGPAPGPADNGATTTTVPVGAAVGGSLGAVALGAAAFFAYSRGFIRLPGRSGGRGGLSAEAVRLI